MTKIFVASDVTGAEEQVGGSNNRMNVSSRADSRSYYNSRDRQSAYSLVWSDITTEAGDFVAYWKNTDTTGKHLVIDACGLNSTLAADFQLVEVTGTAAGGTETTPTCLNRAAPRVAQATAWTAASGPITGLAAGVIIDHAGVTITGHDEFRLDDRLRIGQDGAVAIRCLNSTGTGRSWGVIFGYYE